MSAMSPHRDTACRLHPACGHEDGGRCGMGGQGSVIVDP